MIYPEAISSPGVTPFLVLMGTAIGSIAIGLGYAVSTWHKRKLAASESSAGTTANAAIERALIRLEQEVQNHQQQLSELRQREVRLTAYVGELIGLLRANGIEPPQMPA